MLKPEYARREAAQPIATKADDILAAAWEAAAQWLEGGHVAFSVCIATANPSLLTVERLLSAKPSGIEGSVLTGDYMLTPSRVVVSDIASVKGFEFSLMIITGLDEGYYPDSGVPHEEHWREALRLYVAITRGRDEVRFFYRAQPSSFLLAMEDHIQFHEWQPKLVERAKYPLAEPYPVAVAEDAEKYSYFVVDEKRFDYAAESAPPKKIEATSAVLFEKLPATEFLNGIPIVSVPTKATQGAMASNAWDDPDRDQLDIAGIRGLCVTGCSTFAPRRRTNL